MERERRSRGLPVLESVVYALPAAVALALVLLTLQLVAWVLTLFRTAFILRAG